MNLDTLASQIAVALLGGVAAELLHWYALSRPPGGVGRFKVRTVYWVTTAGMVLLGGVMPVLYLQGTASALLCFHLVAATPVILQKLVANLSNRANDFCASCSRRSPSARSCVAMVTC